MAVLHTNHLESLNALIKKIKNGKRTMSIIFVPRCLSTLILCFLLCPFHLNYLIQYQPPQHFFVFPCQTQGHQNCLENQCLPSVGVKLLLLFPSVVPS